MNNTKLTDLPQLPLNLIGQFLADNVQNGVDTASSLKGLASYNVACKKTNKATNTILNGDTKNKKLGLKDTICVEINLFKRIFGNNVKCKQVPVSMAKILNAIEYFYTDSNKNEKLEDCLIDFSYDFMGLLNNLWNDELSWAKRHKSHGGYSSAEVFKDALDKPSKELEAVFLLMVKIIERKGSDEKHVALANKYKQLAKDAMAPTYAKSKQQMKYCLAILVLLVAIFIAFK